MATSSCENSRERERAPNFNFMSMFLKMSDSAYLIKKTYGHKYYVAASIGFEEKSYPFIRKMKWYTRASNLGVWGGVGPPKIGNL